MKAKGLIHDLRDAIGRALDKVKELLAPPGSLAPVPVRPSRQPGR